MTACEYPLPPIDSVCDVCMVGFTVLEDIWSYGPTVDAFESLLDYVCYIFPEGQWRSECDDFMDQEIDDLIQWVDNTFPPEYICTIIGSCEFPIDPVDDGLCVFCEGAFQFMYDLLDFGTNNGTEIIEIGLDYICWLFPEGDSRV